MQVTTCSRTINIKERNINLSNPAFIFNLSPKFLMSLLLSWTIFRMRIIFESLIILYNFPILVNLATRLKLPEAVNIKSNGMTEIRSMKNQPNI